MVSRGEVGFIIADLSLEVIGQEVYAALVTVIMATTIVSPILMRRLFVQPVFKRKRRPT